MKWEIIGFNASEQILTTKRDGDRYEDFFLIDGVRDSVEVRKHFGDHQYDSGTTVDVGKCSTAAEALLRGALKFHLEL